MILGMSLSTFTIVHVIISLIGIATGLVVLADMLGGIHARVAIFRRFAFVDERRVALSHQELLRIIDAVAVRRDPQVAHDACAHHIRIAGDLALIEYERRAPGFRRD